MVFIDREQGNRAHRAVPDNDLKILDAIASWCGGLHGSMPLADALTALAEGLGADAAALARHHMAEPECRTICTFDKKPDADTLAMRAFAQDAMGHFYDTARSGTVWFMSDLTEDAEWTPSDPLTRWQGERGVREIVVIPLDASVRARDFIEFHFRTPLSRAARHQIEEITRTLVRAWAGRQTGLVTQAQMDERMIRARNAAAAAKKAEKTSILDMSNPARLSRAEFRVCLLLSRGLSTRGVQEELGVGEATIRSHLSKIYSKTECSGQNELLYLLLSGSQTVAQGLAARG